MSYVNVASAVQQPVQYGQAVVQLSERQHRDRKSHQQYLIEYMHRQQVALSQTCESEPYSEACTSHLHYMLWFLSKPRLRNQLPDGQDMAHHLLQVLYNGKQAKQLFVTRLHDINSRAQFFAVNDYVYQASTTPVKWFGVANQVSKECLTGLGAHHCGSYVSFAATKLLGNPNIYAWRQQAGDTVLAGSFEHFRSLFNGQITEAAKWDSDQLTSEQRMLQPIHEQYLAKYRLFNQAYKTVMRIRIPGGVELLQLPSRIRYGYYRMGYNTR